MISFREESTKNGCRTSPVALGTGLYTSVALPSRNVPRTFPEPSCRQSRFTLSLAHSPCFAGSSDGAWRSFSPWGHGISTSGRHCPASWPSALHPFSPSFFSSVASTSSAVPSLLENAPPYPQARYAPHMVEHRGWLSAHRRTARLMDHQRYRRDDCRHQTPSRAQRLADASP